MKLIKRIWNFMKFLEEERIKAMIHSGKAFW